MTIRNLCDFFLWSTIIQVVDHNGHDGYMGRITECPHELMGREIYKCAVGKLILVIYLA